MKDVPCGLCNNYNTQKLYDIADPGAGRYTIVLCKSCQLAYINPRFEENEIEKFYEEDYFAFQGIKQIRQVLYAINAVNELKNFKSSGELLDIGSAKGFFLLVAQKHGYNVTGLEISKYASRFTQDVMGLKTLTGTIEDSPLPEDNFDVITMFDVIEHFQDPKNSLIKIRSSLKDDGILVVDTPNIDSIYSKLRGAKWGGYGKFHLYSFSIDTLKKLLQRAGYSVISASSHKIDLLSIDALWRLGLVDYRISTRLEQKLILSRISQGIDAPPKEAYKKKRFKELKDIIDMQIAHAESRSPAMLRVIKKINSPLNRILKNRFVGDAIRVYAEKK